jgi:threonine/homoserine/homoserine lactone efflux protein
MAAYLILGMTYAFAAAAQPGPLQTYLISRTLTDGFRRAAPGALAPLLSDPPIIVLVLVVLSRMPAWLIPALQALGGVFVMYLAVGAYRTWRSFDAGRSRPQNPGRQTLLRGALINLLNPAPYLSWSLVMGPLLIQGWREAPSNGLALLAGFYAVLILGNLAILALFSGAGKLGSRSSRPLIGLSAIALAALGLYQLLSALRAWLGI